MKTLIKALDDLKLPYNKKVLNQYEIYINEIIRVSENFNLSGAKSWSKIRDDLVIKSLRYCNVINSLMNFKLNSENLQVLDVGTGAGIPSIPMKLLYPEFNLKMVESSKKKCQFLEDVLEKLNCNKVIVENSRIEDMGFGEDREKYDLVLARALAKLPTLAELTIPFSKIDGSIITVKGSYPRKEIEESEYIARLLGINKTHFNKVSSPINIKEDFFVIWDKKEKTPNGFPRKNGIPQKKPIINELMNS
jgi:16S rRNA (guanine527-N7)-methyltransferase